MRRVRIHANAVVDSAIEKIDIGAKTASASAASSRPGSAATSSRTTAPVPASPCSRPIASAWRGLRTCTWRCCAALAAAQVAVAVLARGGGARRRGSRRGPTSRSRAPASRTITTPTARSAASSSQPGSSDLKAIIGSPTSTRQIACPTPHHAPSRAARARVAAVRGDERRDRDEVVGIGGVPQPEHERDRQRDEQRRALEQPGEPVVGRLERAEQSSKLRRSRRWTCSCVRRPPRAAWP